MSACGSDIAHAGTILRDSTYEQVGVRGHHHESWLDIMLSCSLPQDRQQEQGHVEGRHDIDGNGALEAAVALDISADCDASVLDDDVDPVQLGPRAPAEGPDALEAAEVELPGVDDATPGRGRLDIGPCRPALIEVATGQDDLGRPQAAEVTRGFPAETHISAGHDYCFPTILGLRVRQGAQLAGEEVDWVPCRPEYAGQLTCLLHATPPSKQAG